MKILAINPGSTSTKVAVYEDTKEILTVNIKHDVEELAGFTCVFDQYDFRKNIVLKKLEEEGIDVASLDVIAGRGGLHKPILGGVYEINPLMLDDIKHPKIGEHVCNLGAPIAYEIAKEASKLSGKNVKAYTVDTSVVDEMEPIAKFSGMPEIERRSIFHALNQKAVARRYARERGKKYEDLNYIVAHMGGGISIGAHKGGRVIDVNNALNGEGPFTPERSGGVPVGQLVNMCFSGEYTKAEIMKKIKGNGGLVAYLGTNSAYEVEQRVKAGDKEWELVYKAMAYQVAKGIGALAAALEGKVDVIILTGGIAYDKMFVGWIKDRVSFIADVEVFPGEDEMKALAEGCYYGIKGEIPVHVYE